MVDRRRLEGVGDRDPLESDAPPELPPAEPTATPTTATPTERETV